MKYSAKFHVFMEVMTLIKKLIPPDTQFTAEQANAVHEFARKIAKDLTSGEFVND